MTTYFNLGAEGTEAEITALKAFLVPKLHWEKRHDITACWLRIELSDTVHCLQWDWSEDEPISVKALDTGLYRLCFSGGQMATPLQVLERLSLRFPSLEWFLSATTEQEDHEYWTARNGELSPIDLYFQWIQEDVRITFVQDGKELVPPEFKGDMLDGNGGLVQITHEQLAESCKSLYRTYLGKEYPGEHAELLAKAEEFVSSRLGDTNPTSEPVLQMAQEIAARRAQPPPRQQPG